MKAFLSIVFVSLLMTSCARKFDEKVVVIEKTRSYHRPNCGQVIMARGTVVSREDAQVKNFRPCPYCQPDRGLAGKPDQLK